jgi:hypothetical protein
MKLETIFRDGPLKRVISVNRPKAQRAYCSGHMFNKIMVLEIATTSSLFS